MRIAALMGVALVACVPRVDYEDTEYQCPDGVTCPDGFRCELDRCVRGAPGDVDAGPDAEPPGDPDAGPAPMVPVPAGAFYRGCDFASGLADCDLDSVPGGGITLSAFEIDVHEVTQREYAACVTAGLCATPRDNYDPVALALHPVTDVSWVDATSYCAFVGKRLPSEAEWEKAARGPDGRTYPWGEDAPDCTRANFSACSGKTLPVGTLLAGASPYGALDMAGNVAEWVNDWFSNTYYAQSPDTDPPGPASGSQRVVRGGGFESSSSRLRTYDRDSLSPDNTDDSRGFRCAR